MDTPPLNKAIRLASYLPDTQSKYSYKLVYEFVMVQAATCQEIGQLVRIPFYFKMKVYTSTSFTSNVTLSALEPVNVAFPNLVVS